jgi:hypothetical protein
VQFEGTTGKHQIPIYHVTAQKYFKRVTLGIKRHYNHGKRQILAPSLREAVKQNESTIGDKSRRQFTMRDFVNYI